MTQLPRLNAMVEFLEAHEPAEMARLRAANPAAAAAPSADESAGAAVELRAKAAALEPRIRLYLVTGESGPAALQYSDNALELTGQLNKIADAIGVETKIALAPASA